MAGEPTAALDRQSGREVVELMQQLARETRCAVLLVTHDSRILDIADRILTLEDGRIEETDLAFDRVLGELNEFMTLLARYPTAFHSLDAVYFMAFRAVFLLNRIAGGLVEDVEVETKG
jgi:ABC-type glutathione transport system ATPase component